MGGVDRGCCFQVIRLVRETVPDVLSLSLEKLNGIQAISVLWLS
jgi:hypothetical protein